MQNKIVNMVRTTLAVMVLIGLTALPATSLTGIPPAIAQGCGWVDKTADYWKNITLEQIQACIDKGVDVNAGNGDEETLLHLLASSNKNPEIVKLLVDAGANIDAREELFGATPLHIAAGENNNPQMINALLDAGANVHARTKLGFASFHLAAGGNNNPEIIKILSDAGADVNAQNSSKSTPLHLAAKDTKNPEVIIALIKAGADGKAVDKEGKKPLDYANKNEVLKDTRAYWALNNISY